MRTGCRRRQLHAFKNNLEISHLADAMMAFRLYSGGYSVTSRPLGNMILPEEKCEERKPRWSPLEGHLPHDGVWQRTDGVWHRTINASNGIAAFLNAQYKHAVHASTRIRK